MTFLPTRMPPSLWYTVALMSGIALSAYTDTAHALVIIGLSIFAVLWLDLYVPTYLPHLARLIATVCCGYGLMALQQRDHALLLHKYSNQKVSCMGIIIEATYTPHVAMRHRLLCSISKIRTETNPTWQKVPHPLLMINTNTNYSSLIGSEIQINDIKLSSPKGDFKRFCVRKNLIASLYVSLLSVEILSCPRYSFCRTLNRIHQNLITLFKKHLSRTTFTLFSAIFLGHTDSIKKELKKFHALFQRWGIVHYLARSGLHLVIVTIVLEYTLSLVPLSFLVRRVIIMSSACIYWLCTWSSVSFYRALALFFMANSLLITRRPYNFLHLLFTLCSLFLLINPSHLFFLDFQLTFALTALLALFNSSVTRHL